MSIYQIICRLQDTDVSRAPCGVGNMDIAYAIAIGCINTPKVHTRLECHCSHIMCIYVNNMYIYIHVCTLMDLHFPC